MKKYLFNNSIVGAFFILISSAYSGELFADLEQGIRELVIADSDIRKNELINEILSSREDMRAVIKKINLTPDQVDSLFGAFIKSKTPYSTKFLVLFDSFFSQFALEDIPQMPNTAWLFVKFMPKIGRGAERLFNKMGNKIIKLISDSIDVFYAHESDFNMLIQVLESEIAPSEFRIKFYKNVLMSSKFLPAMEKLLFLNSDAQSSKKSIQQNIFEYIINRNENWIDKTHLMLLALESKEPLITYFSREEILKNIENDLKQGMKFTNGFSRLFMELENKEAVDFRAKVFSKIEDALFRHDENSLNIFKNTFESTIKNSKSEAGKSLLTYQISVILENLPSLALELNKYKSSIIEISSKLPFDPSYMLTLSLLSKLTDKEFQKELQKNNLSWLFEAITQPILLDLLREPSDDEELTSDALNLLLPELYKSELKTFSNMIFSDLPKSIAKDKGAKPPQGSVSQVICNQEGYDEGVRIDCTKGAVLTLDDGTPIGYNVHLPYGDVQAVFTTVYGGFNKNNRIDEISKPYQLNKLEKYLLAHGIAIVTLNLVNFQSTKPFYQMPRDIHDRFHASINKYFQALNKGTLHKHLESLKGLPNFLAGASFGGRDAIRHAEIKEYADTFDGYLSISGWISLEVDAKDCNWIDVCPATIEARSWLDPINDIENIKKPILIIQNFDDNNVNIAVSLDWYKKAQKILKPLGRADLIKILIASRGNPMSSAISSNNKGHYLATDPENLRRIGSFVLRFMLEGPSAIPANLSELDALTYGLYAYRNTKHASPAKKFLSEAYRHFKANQGSIPIDDQTWNKDYVPLYYAVESLERLKEQKLPLSMEINRLKKFLTQDVLQKALETHALLFSNFLKEKYLFKIDDETLTRSIINNDSIREQFKSWILSAEKEANEFLYYILSKLYIGNPKLLEEYYPMFRSQKGIEEALSKAKLKLEEKIRRENQLRNAIEHR